MTTLADGMRGTETPELTVCACWSVTFDRYSFTPTVVVPFDTPLEDVHRIARQALLGHLSGHGAYTDRDIEADVAKRRLLQIERLPDVCLSPTLG